MTKRTFDLILLTLLLSKPAFGLVRMAAARRASDANPVVSVPARATLLVA